MSNFSKAENVNVCSNFDHYTIVTMQKGLSAFKQKHTVFSALFPTGQEQTNTIRLHNLDASAKANEFCEADTCLPEMFGSQSLSHMPRT